jgi:hypothetical protein
MKDRAKQEGGKPTAIFHGNVEFEVEAVDHFQKNVALLGQSFRN